MSHKDVQRMANILSGVNVIDIVGFGSCMSPDYLFKLMIQSKNLSNRNKKYGFICPTFPGSGMNGGINELADSGLIEWTIGGFYGAARKLGLDISRGIIDGYTIPQGVVSHLLTHPERTMCSDIGCGTLVDPQCRGGALGDVPKLTPVRSIEKPQLNQSGMLSFTLPDSDLVLMRGAGFTDSGDIILESFPIHLDLKDILISAKIRGAKVVIQVPDLQQVPSIDSNCVSPDLFDAVLISPPAYHQDTYRSEYSRHSTDGKLFRQNDVVDELAVQLRQRLNPHERIIAGIGLPVAAVNTINDPYEKYCVSVESGNIGGYPIDGIGFGISINPQNIISQKAMFSDIWSGKFDHALLGVGDMDDDGNIYVAKLGEQTFGIGGFIDIVNSVNKITFVGRKGKKKFQYPKSEWVCYKHNCNTDVKYILA
ncbi:hypothetical protein [Vibrio spartinae]|uniref:Acetate CoA-transferase YdiF n=1 Tax=Vibrio spartinae TaxID=1918945 RepID=A0A1N6M331_9VIBR|nr:hypothetical protein [Vibrio spartinae]QMV14335.1 Acetate CoA-transferase YdiF [Vibrio spartinae]SIO93815.1 Acetate CoA-transferase YdiF [Vibrio spartinae]